MGKKIRITESQLKTIIKSKQVLKEFYDSPAPGVVDQLKDQIFPMIMDALTQEAEQNNHAPFDGLDESLKATTIDQVFYLLKEAMKQSMGLPNDKDKEGEEEDTEEPMDDMPGFEGTMDALNSLSIRKNNDDMMNESKQLIKNNFKRFL
jgi:hypothetical protein